MSRHSYTPFGYLQNPYYQCNSGYYDVQSGVICSSRSIVGFGCVVPFPKRPHWEVAMGIGLRVDGRVLVTRADLAGYPLDAVVHTPFRFVYRLRVDDIFYHIAFHLEARDLVRLQVWSEPSAPASAAAVPPGAVPPAGENAGACGPGARRPGARSRCEVLLVGYGWRADSSIAVSEDRSPELPAPAIGLRLEREDDERFATPPVVVSTDPAASGSERWIVADSAVALARALEGATGRAGVGEREPAAWEAAASGGGADRDSLRHAGSEVWFARPLAVSALVGPDGESAGVGSRGAGATLRLETPPGRTGVAEPIATIGDGAQTAADRFVEMLPRLTGAFPPRFVHGVHYDFETTRLCTLPPAGIFHGHWPTWMASMPRAVLAEGAMDMARLAYADPSLAQEAVLTLLRDTPADNVPCVFANGTYNMVAADGSRCGTSPAWCIPFFHIHDLYLRSIDNAWLAEVYPHLVRLVEFWLSERTDADGGLSYRCTWEAGEDNNPRIDPAATGDNVISEFVSPVELHASIAQAAGALATYARVLGVADDERRFDALRSEYVAKTRRFWDPQVGRFRDWDRRRNDFVEVVGREDYWGADFTRMSPLSLIAVLNGVADEGQLQAMREEVRRFFRTPFTIWPSWATFVLEAAAAVGLDELRGAMAYEIASRVFAAADARTIEEQGGVKARRMPGVSPEYWPYAPDTFDGNDTYAWGAQTTTFVIRHILGILPTDDAGAVGLRLRPSIAPGLFAEAEAIAARSGSPLRLGIENLAHRGRRVAVSYELGAGTIDCEVDPGGSLPLDVWDSAGGDLLYRSDGAQTHRFRLPTDAGRPREVVLR